MMVTSYPGSIVLFGSGETSTEGQRVHEWVMRRMTEPVRAAVLETPAGFEMNSSAVAGRLAEFLRVHLQNYRPTVNVIAARRKGTDASPDNPTIVEPIWDANYLMLGPGSPSYAARQLRDSLAWHVVLARQRLGNPLILASAAAIAASAFALPVYEIYKVGEDPHWKSGLDLFSPFGAKLAIVPHWNNAEGGEALDTSHCFMGEARFADLVAQLPDGAIVVGIDERTALVLDFEAACLRVMGAGSVTIVNAGCGRVLDPREEASLDVLGITRLATPDQGVPPEVWREAVDRSTPRGDVRPAPPDEVRALAQRRADARASRDWPTADRLRRELAERGWMVRDAANGYEIVPAVDR